MAHVVIQSEDWEVSVDVYDEIEDMGTKAWENQESSYVGKCRSCFYRIETRGGFEDTCEAASIHADRQCTRKAS